MEHYFNHVWNMVKDLKATSSTKDKRDIIVDYCYGSGDEHEFTMNILLYTYHPLWQYNVTSDNLKKKSSLRGRSYNSIFLLLDDLKNRKVTGHDAIGSVNSFICDHKTYEELIHCIIDKDLKTRAGDKIINKAITDLIPEFSVSLADKYEPNLVDWRNGWYVSRKIDGARCIAIVDENGETIFLSRSGKVFDTLNNLSDSIRSLGVSNVVFDGELCLVDEHGDEDFQGIMKELRKKNHTIKNPSYKIFDMISHDEFYTKKGDSNKIYSYRYKNLIEAMKKNKSSFLSVLEQERVKDDYHLIEWVGKSNQNGWEGLMLRADKPYKGKRSKDLLKYKSFYDDEYKVLDVEFGPFRYVKDGVENEEQMLSCIKIEHKGHQVKVGSGFTIDQRKEFYLNPHEILGKIITVQYFAESKNQDGGISLRFPTFKFLHGNSRKI